MARWSSLTLLVSDAPPRLPELKPGRNRRVQRSRWFGEYHFELSLWRDDAEYNQEEAERRQQSKCQNQQYETEGD